MQFQTNFARLLRELTHRLNRHEDGRRAVAARVPLAALPAAEPRTARRRELELLEVEAPVVADEQLAARLEAAGEVRERRGQRLGRQRRQRKDGEDGVDAKGGTSGLDAADVGKISPAGRTCNDGEDMLDGLE